MVHKSPVHSEPDGQVQTNVPVSIFDEHCAPFWHGEESHGLPTNKHISLVLLLMAS